MKKMTKKVKEIKEKEIDEILREVNEVKDDARMYKAVKKLNRKRYQNPFIHNKEGKAITQKQEIYKIIEEHFKNHFYKEGIDELEKFKEEPKKLKKEIKATDVQKAASRMANSKAPGRDNINVELIKYGPKSIHEEIADNINGIFENHDVIEMGAGILIPLQKPKKTKGPVKNLRPVTLLEVIRKILSKIFVTRTEEVMKKYLSDSQSAYRKFRSTTDVIWTYRWIIAKIQEQDIDIFVTGIDMSSAFDTIYRDKVLEIAEEVMEEDEVRILRILLSETTLEVKVNGAESKPFKSNIGSPQGDSASGPLFNMYFEKQLKEIRKEINNIPIKIDQINEKWIERRNSSLPTEMIYADDCDLLTEEEDIRAVVNEKVTEILGKGNLLVNEEKTEHTTLKRGDRNTEMWRNVNKLGSLLGDKEDINRRKQLSCIALRDLKNIWRKKKSVSLEKRIKLYETLVKSVLLYNCSTWGLSIQDERDLNSFHRQQLRRILGIQWPHKIRNKKVYEKTNSKPISIEITERRWKTFGHTLRMDSNTPARQAMKFFFEKRSNRKYVGRKRTSIITTINRDIKRTRKEIPSFVIKELKTEIDLHNVRVKAQNRRHWTKIVNQVVEVAYSETSQSLKC